MVQSRSVTELRFYHPVCFCYFSVFYLQNQGDCKAVPRYPGSRSHVRHVQHCLLPRGHSEQLACTIQIYVVHFDVCRRTLPYLKRGPLYSFGHGLEWFGDGGAGVDIALA